VRLLKQSPAAETLKCKGRKGRQGRKTKIKNFTGRLLNKWDLILTRKTWIRAEAVIDGWSYFLAFLGELGGSKVCLNLFHLSSQCIEHSKGVCAILSLLVST
jgi:hypothetical protein